MPKLKVMGGKDVVKIFSTLGFEITSQKGSHIKMKRIMHDGSFQTWIFPLHNELDKGTLKAIINQASKYIPKQTLKEYFYTEWN